MGEREGIIPLTSSETSFAPFTTATQSSVRTSPSPALEPPGPARSLFGTLILRIRPSLRDDAISFSARVGLLTKRTAWIWAMETTGGRARLKFSTSAIRVDVMPVVRSGIGVNMWDLTYWIACGKEWIGSDGAAVTGVLVEGKRSSGIGDASSMVASGFVLDRGRDGLLRGWAENVDVVDRLRGGGLRGFFDMRDVDEAE